MINKDIANQLLKYSAAAGAGAFFLSNANAAIIWQDNFSPVSLSSTSNSIQQFRLDIDADGDNDVFFRAYTSQENEVIRLIDRANPRFGLDGGILNPFSSYYIEGFATNEIIGPDSLSKDEDASRTGEDIIVRWDGNELINDFSSQGYDYLGIELNNNGNTHYGWIGVSFATDGLGDVTMLIEDYAWNSTPNERIAAGATSGAVPEPATYALGLGLLALGAAGIRARRQARKHSA